MTTEKIQTKIQNHKKQNVHPPRLTMKVKEIIERIENMGYLVKLTHYRYFGLRLLKNADIHVLVRAMKIMGENYTNDIRQNGGMIMGRGGRTEVEVYDLNDLEERGTAEDRYKTAPFQAKAECSKQDNFVYSKASRLALYRVLDQLSDKEAKNLRKKMESMYLKYQIQVKEGDKWMDFKHPDYSSSEDRAIAENEAEALRHETGKEVRVVSVFE